MTWSHHVWRIAMLFLLCLGSTGCFSSGDNEVDEQKEPHFLRGRNLVAALDYAGAVTSFEKSLEVNPHSAAAHYELACLFENQVTDPAAAIYHYQQYLRIQQKAPNADVVRERITRCKFELAKTVSALPLTPSVQRELDKTIAENRDLKTEVAQWRAYYAAARRAAAATPVTNTPIPIPDVTTNVVRAVQPVVRQEKPIVSAPAVTNTPAFYPSNRTSPVSSTRTHAVKSGDFPGTIAKKYGISLSALQAANPQMKATHLQIGQTLVIPPP